MVINQATFTIPQRRNTERPNIRFQPSEVTTNVPKRVATNTISPSQVAEKSANVTGNVGGLGAVPVSSALSGALNNLLSATRNMYANGQRPNLDKGAVPHVPLESQRLGMSGIMVDGVEIPMYSSCSLIAASVRPACEFWGAFYDLSTQLNNIITSLHEVVFGDINCEETLYELQRIWESVMDAIGREMDRFFMQHEEDFNNIGIKFWWGSEEHETALREALDDVRLRLADGELLGNLTIDIESIKKRVQDFNFEIGMLFDRTV